MSQMSSPSFVLCLKSKKKTFLHEIKIIQSPRRSSQDISSFLNKYNTRLPSGRRRNIRNLNEENFCGCRSWIFIAREISRERKRSVG
jgi:hypothetical protein